MTASPPASALPEIARRVTGILELDANLPRGALTAPGRGQRGMIFGRYLSAYIMVEHFDVPVEVTAALLNRDRGTVTKALKVFRFLEGYQGWRRALETLADLSRRLVEYGQLREGASEQIPAPVGRERRNDDLPAWVRERYASEIEAASETEIAAEARAEAEADSIYLSHPAVRAITDDPDLVSLLGNPVVSVSLGPLDDQLKLGRAILLVPPEERASGAVALRVLVKGEGPSDVKTMLEARGAISKALLREGFRLTGVAETFSSREHEGWRYMPLHIAQVRSFQ